MFRMMFLASFPAVNVLNTQNGPIPHHLQAGEQWVENTVRHLLNDMDMECRL